MNCDQVQQVATEYALGLVEDSSAEDVARHLATGCSECASVVAEAQAAIALLPLELDGVAPAAEVEQRIFDRIDHLRASGSSPATLPMSPQAPTAERVESVGNDVAGRVAAWAPAAAAALLLAAGTLGYLAGAWIHGPSPADRQAARFDEQQRSAANEQFAELISQARAEGALLSRKGLRLVDFEPAGSDAAARGYVAADASAGQWHLFIYDLPRLSGDRAYRAWLVRPRQAKDDWSPGGKIVPNQRGAAAVVVAMPDDADQVAMIVLTVEPATNVATPTGEVVLAAELSRPN